VEKFALGLIASLVLLCAVGGAVYMNHRSGEVLRSCEVLSGDVSDLKEELQAAREEIQALAEGIHHPPPPTPGGRPEVTSESPPVESPAAPGLASVPHEEIRSFVAVALDEERKQREDERKKQREEFRKRAEARRKEAEAFREGPYDRYNLKVNSLAQALSLSEAQKQAYFELSKQTAEKYQEERRKLQAAADPGTPGSAKGGKGRDRTAVRQLSETLQNEFSAAVESMLAAPQVDAYRQLSAPSRSFQSLGQVSTAGEDNGPPMFRGGNGDGGGGGNRGQGPRGR
jgi:hypothetical protein